jgi:putative ABC transport system permease protein
MLSDLRFAVRSLLKTPGFTVVAIAIVALGIGAATAMFSTVNALVLRPFSLPEPHRLAVVYETNLARNLPRFSVSLPNYADWKARCTSWESLAAIDWRAMNLTGSNGAELIQVRPMTADFLPTLGLAPVLGRGFQASEDLPGRNQVAIISHAFWQRHFGGKSDVIGQTLTLDGTAYNVVGVVARDAMFPGELEIAIPLAAAFSEESRTHHYADVYGRLKPGVSLEQADSELKAIAAQVWAEHPEMEQGWSTQLVSLSDNIVGENVRRMLTLLIASVGLLLVIVCANLSNLLLVRASARAHDLAIRSALGATRTQIARQVVLESLVVTLAGGAVGIVVSLWAVELLRSMPFPRAGEISVDGRVLAIGLITTLLAGFFSGLGPAIKAAFIKPQDALKAHAPRSGHRSRLLNTMVIGQLAVSLTLLVGATLLARSFLRLLQVNPGFNAENAVAVSLRYSKNEGAAQFYERLSARIAAIPGVSHNGLISALPLTEGNTSLNVFPRGESVVPSGQSIQASWRLIDSGYFDAMQIPLKSGRTFAGMSPEEARSSVIISATLARLLWGDADPIGRQLDPGGGNRLVTVIGVVGNVRSQNLGTESVPAFYWSMHRFIYGPMHLVVRIGAGPDGENRSRIDGLVPAIRAAVKEIDPTVPVFRVRTLQQLRATSLDQERLMLMLLSGFTGVALLLAALGTYGVIAFTLQQRTREIGIRIAVGAQAGDILHLVLGQGFRLIALGALLGLAGAHASTRLLSTMLYQTGLHDPLSYLAATIILALTAILAALIPARRATKVDPITALRAE